MQQPSEKTTTPFLQTYSFCFVFFSLARASVSLASPPPLFLLRLIFWFSFYVRQCTLFNIKFACNRISIIDPTDDRDIKVTGINPVV